MYVCLSVRMEQLGYQRTDFRKNFEYFTKICQRIRVSLKSDTKNGCFTWRPTYIFDHMSPICPHNEKRFKQKCTENQKNILCSKRFSFRNSCRLWHLWKNIVKPQATDDNMTHMHCMLGTSSYKHILRMLYFFILYCNNGCMNAPHCYVIRTSI
jgi:hypothetical protein